MPRALHQLVERQAVERPDAEALRRGEERLSYAELWERTGQAAERLLAQGVSPGDRVALWLPKIPEQVVLALAASATGAVFVPVNPVLKAAQVGHILRDAGARWLVTQAARLATITEEIDRCPYLEAVFTVDTPPPTAGARPLFGGRDEPTGTAWDHLPVPSRDRLAALFYTSGSTGRPKGVMVSHGNLLLGAESVASYLENRSDDRLLAVLPLSFDYGFSQLTTAFHVGGAVILLDYVLPAQIPKAVEAHRITGLAGVPSLWCRLADLEWPESARRHLRYITNSGGTLPRSVIRRLGRALPQTQLFLMYGLTEAFRSTYLPPRLLSEHPDSIGRPIPGAEVHVVRPDGSECAPDEVGELVHVGPLVAQGYWGRPASASQVFRPWRDGRPAVWSGDRVRRDRHGLLYFCGRDDDTIKTSGYRVSPQEVEEVAMQCAGVRNAVALGLPHPVLGQAIALAFEGDASTETIRAHLKQHLPTYMQPARIERLDTLPLTPNGKPDRPAVRVRLEQTA